MDGRAGAWVGGRLARPTERERGKEIEKAFAYHVSFGSIIRLYPFFSTVCSIHSHSGWRLDKMNEATSTCKQSSCPAGKQF